MKNDEISVSGKIAVPTAFDAFLAKCGRGVINVFLIGATITIVGYAMSKMWLWIIAPTFGIKALTVAQCAGIVLICRYTINTPKADDVKKRPSWGTVIFLNILSAAAFIGMAWVLKRFFL